MKTLGERLATFMRGKATTFTTMHNLSGDWPENSKTEMTYTRKQVQDAMKTFFTTAKTEGPKYASHLPTSPNNAGIIRTLAETTTVKGESRPLVFQALAGVRSAHKRSMKNLEKQAVIKATGAWYHPAAYSVDNNGGFVAFREYESAAQAAKAAARATYNVKANPDTGTVAHEWWQSDKASRLGTMLEDVSQVMPNKPATSTKQALKSLSSMSHAKVRAIVKKAGAPASVYTGKDATARSLLWATENGSAVAQFL